jgi:hypothetical protein
VRSNCSSSTIPQAAAGDAAALVDEAARSLIAAVESRRAAMAGPTTDDS